jgi:hypothetical protein
MLAGFPFIQYYGRQQCHPRLDQTASDRCPTRRETERCCFARLDAFFCELKSYETQRDKISIILCFILF